MGLLGNLIVKGVSTALTNSTIRTVGNATVGVIAATGQTKKEKEDVVVKNGVLYLKPTRSSEDYINVNVLDVAQEFQSMEKTSSLESRKFLLHRT